MDSATDWAILFAALSGISAVATVIIAALTFQNLQQDSHDRSRPIVVARIRTGPSFALGTSYLVINNMGASIARDISVSFDPPLQPDPGGLDPTLTLLRLRYETPLELLAPGEQLKNTAYFLNGDDEDQLPSQITVTVRYRDDRHRRYHDAFVLDYGKVATETTGNPSDTNRLDLRYAKGIEAIGWQLWDR